MDRILLIMIALEVVIAILLIMIFIQIKATYFQDIKKEKRIYHILNDLIKRKRGF